MTFFDYCIIICLAVFVFAGLGKGLIRGLADIVAVIVALVGATRFMSNFTGILSAFIPISPILLTIISFIIIYAILYYSVIFGGQVLAKLVKFALLGWLDRLLGALFGFFKGAFLISLFLFLVTLLPLPKAVFASYDKGLLVQPIKNVTPTVFDALQWMLPGGRPFNYELCESMMKNTSGTFSKHMKDTRLKRFFSTLQEE